MNNQFTLSPKNEEILHLRRNGNTLKQIAAKVFLSKEAVRDRLCILRQKAGVKNDIELIDYCHRNGLFSTKAA